MNNDGMLILVVFVQSLAMGFFIGWIWNDIRRAREEYKHVLRESAELRRLYGFKS